MTDGKNQIRSQETLHAKLERIVRKFGFDDIRVSSIKSGHVELTGTVNDINDRALIVAIARTTPGVQKFTLEIKIEND
ncbi:BON domain-containing protein [Novipirellula rosea]|uniref:BON domain-containing protein n=1 Tax=Novipirellula rosea TaxID=1031540 RepID=A0ABP8NN20_9BACT